MVVPSHFFLWPTGCEWHCTFCERHHISFNDQQEVISIAHFVKGNLITFFTMTNREWVILHVLWKAVGSSHLAYEQQRVSNIAHFQVVKHNIITSFLMTNSKWVTLHTLWKACSSHLFLWLTASEWIKGKLFTCFPMTNSEWVTLHGMWKAVLSYDQ